MERFSRWRATPILLGTALAAILGTACTGGSPSANGSSGSTAGGATPPSVTVTGGAAGTGAPGQSVVPSSQSPVPAESNPPGDIPDNTVFVPYASRAGGFTIKVPEGWARSSSSSAVGWTFALNSIGAVWAAASAAPTVASARSTDVPALRQSELAFALQGIKAVTLPGGAAVLITFQENSQPNPVTGKQYRMAVLRFEFFKGGTEAALTLSAPVGSDNVDPWRTISESFRWA
jgi:hypothetical protein